MQNNHHRPESDNRSNHSEQAQLNLQLKFMEEVHTSINPIKGKDAKMEHAVLKDGQTVKAAVQAHGPQQFEATLRPLAEAFNKHHNSSERKTYKSELIEYFSKQGNFTESAATYATANFPFDQHANKISREQLKRKVEGDDAVSAVVAGYLLHNIDKLHVRRPGEAKLPAEELSRYDMHRLMEKGNPKYYERGTALYASADKLSSIRPEGVSQGDLGDCYFLAAVSAVAAKHPENIRNMIFDHRDGSYTVTFPGAPETPVTVRASGHGQLDKFAHDTGYGTWAHILEKAHRRLTGRETSDEGGRENDGLKLLTGAKIENAQFDQYDFPETIVPGYWSEDKPNEGKTSLAQTEALLTRAAANKFPAVAVAHSGDHSENDPGEIPGDHLYCVSAYDKKARVVTLINPWEDASQKYGGKFQLPLKEFTNRFHGLAIADSE